MTLSLDRLYQSYIDCLNRQAWDELDRHVAEDVEHNGRPFGLTGYQAMLVEDFRSIPDLRFHVDMLVCAPPRLAARLLFDCTPQGSFLGLAVDGRRISFSENVFYTYVDGKIASVWSVIDKNAIEEQLGR